MDRIHQPRARHVQTSPWVLMSPYHVPEAVHRASHILIHLTSHTLVRYPHHPHCTVEKLEAQKNKGTCPRSHVRWGSSGWKTNQHQWTCSSYVFSKTSSAIEHLALNTTPVPLLWDSCKMNKYCMKEGRFKIQSTMNWLCLLPPPSLSLSHHTYP